MHNEILLIRNGITSSIPEGRVEVRNLTFQIYQCIFYINMIKLVRIKKYTKRRHNLKHIFSIKNTIVSVLSILIFITSTAYSKDTIYKIELPDGAIARLGKGRIYDMQYTDDGARIAASTSMGIWVYDAINFTEIYLLRKHTKHADYLAFSPDGKTLVSADTLGAIHLWDMDTGKHKKELTTNRGGLLRITFNLNGTSFGVLKSNGSVILWDTSTWEEKHEFKKVFDLSERSIMSIAISQNNFLIATGNLDSSVSLYDTVNATSEHMSEAHDDSYVSSVTFNHDETLLASSSFGKVIVWDTATGEQKKLIDSIQGIVSVRISPDGNLLALMLYNGDIHLFSINSGEEFRVLKGHTGRILTTAFSSDMRTIATASVDGSVRIWNVFTGKPIQIFDGHFGNFTCLDVSPDGKTAVAPSTDLTVCLWDVATGKTKKTFNKEGFYGVAEVAFDPTGNIIATASFGKFISLWNSETSEHLTMLKGHEDHLSSVMFSPDGKMIASGSHDSTVRIWDVETYKVKYVLNGHEDIVSSVTFSPDGTTIASGSIDDRIILWDASTGEEKDVLAGHEGDVINIAFSPDGTKLASVALSSEIFLWKVESGELDKVIHAGDTGISSVMYHPNGNAIAIGWDTGEVQIIDVKSEKSLQTFSGHQKQVSDLSFALDGKNLVSLSDDGVMFVWEITAIAE